MFSTESVSQCTHFSFATTKVLLRRAKKFEMRLSQLPTLSLKLEGLHVASGAILYLVVDDSVRGLLVASLKKNQTLRRIIVSK